MGAGKEKVEDGFPKRSTRFALNLFMMSSPGTED